MYKKESMKKDESVSDGYLLAFIKSIFSCFLIKENREDVKAGKLEAASCPEAAIIAASKHFSSAHKVQFG